jgi:hypothetical protein
MKRARSIAQKHFRILFASLGIFSLLMAMAAAPVIAYETSMGGNYPACQNRCLSEHAKKVQIISERYATEGNIQSFQDSIDIAVEQYAECIYQCRMVLPVK